MKIKIERELLFSKNELRAFSLLESDKYLDKFIPLARKESGIPKSGFKKIEPQITSKLTSEQKYRLLGNAQALLKRYNYGVTFWLSSFLNLILFGTITPATRVKNNPIQIESNGSINTKIIIREKTSVNQLVSWIKENKVYVEQELNLLPNPPKSKFENAKLKGTVLRRRQARGINATYGKIGDKISKHYNDSPPILTDYATLAVYTQRIQEAISKMIKTNKIEDQNILKVKRNRLANKQSNL